MSHAKTITGRNYIMSINVMSTLNVFANHYTNFKNAFFKERPKANSTLKLTSEAKDLDDILF